MQQKSQSKTKNVQCQSLIQIFVILGLMALFGMLHLSTFHLMHQKEELKVVQKISISLCKIEIHLIHISF